MLLRDYLRWPGGLLRVLRFKLLPGGPVVHRSEEAGDAGDLPGPVPDADPLVQLVSDGVGDLLHRHYSVVVDRPRRTPEGLMDRFAEDPNCAVPDVAVFARTRGGPGPLALGDEYRILILGPWDGPVRVVGMTPTAVRLATLSGHLEAGQIEFRASSERGPAGEPDAALRFTIESWARSGDRVSRLLYDWLPLAKEIQLTVWAQTCAAMAALAGGELRDGVTAHTRRVPADLVARPPAGV
nr:hypothetical protein [uncultured bacterium]